MPVGHTSLSNDLPNVFNLYKFQNTRSTDKVRDTPLPPFSDDIKLENNVKPNNSDVVNSKYLAISVLDNNVITGASRNIANGNLLMTISEIAVCRITQSMTSYYETVKFNNAHSNYVIANTNVTNINTPSDNMLTSDTDTQSIDDMYKT